MDDKWKEKIKSLRTKYMKNPNEYLEESKKITSNKIIFEKKRKISNYVNELYSKSYQLMISDQKKFRKEILEYLVKIKKINDSASFIDNVINNYDEIYWLTKSDSQSNKSRSGRMLELIVEDILDEFKYAYDSQKKIGKKKFLTKIGKKSINLGKQIDTIIPSIQEYKKNPSNCILLSQKTTLRERWQQVGEEVLRVNLPEAYIITLGEDLTEEKVETAKENRIQIVVPEKIKNNKFKNTSTVFSFEIFFKKRIKSSIKRINENN